MKLASKLFSYVIIDILVAILYKTLLPSATLAASQESLKPFKIRQCLMKEHFYGSLDNLKVALKTKTGTVWPYSHPQTSFVCLTRQILIMAVIRFLATRRGDLQFGIRQKWIQHQKTGIETREVLFLPWRPLFPPPSWHISKPDQRRIQQLTHRLSKRKEIR